jgi:hypothetical protein
LNGGNARGEAGVVPIVLIGENKGVMKVNDAWPINPIVSLIDIFWNCSEHRRSRTAI